MTLKQPALGLSALCLTLMAGGAMAQTVGSYSLWVPPQAPIMPDISAWSASLSEASNGEVTFDLYPAQQLGAAVDHYDMARDGIVDMAMVAPGYTPGRFPIWNLIEMPFNFTNSIGGARALHEWYLDYAEREMGDVKFCFVSMHHPGTLHTTNREVRLPEDVAGMKIRPGGPGTAAFMTHLGAAVVQAALPEMRELAERGVVDGVAMGWDIFTYGADPILRTQLDMPFYVTAQAHVINLDFYNGLSENARAAVDAHCTPEWTERIAVNWSNAETAARDRLIASPDHNTVELTAEEVAAWQAAAAPVVAEAQAAVDQRYGGELKAAEVYDALRASIAAHDSLYGTN